MKKLNLYALSGSLRKASYNSTALHALTLLAPVDVTIEVGDIGSLPLFNPDLEETRIDTVSNLKGSLKNSDGLILASPEYAHGISGPMKNALDWMVSDIDFPGKKIMLINTSPRASHALLALKEVLKTMSGNVIDSAYVSVPLLGSNLNKETILNDSGVKLALKIGLQEFIDTIKDPNYT